MAARRQPVDREARAKTLTVTRLDASRLHVTGGESEHALEILGDGTVRCRCEDADFNKAVCAHAIAGRWFLEREAAAPVAEEGRDVPFLEPVDKELGATVTVTDPPSAVVATITPPLSRAREGAHASNPAVKAVWSNDAEQAVLSAILLDQGDPALNRATVLRAAEILDDATFYREAHRLVFRAMLSLTERGDVIDPVTLRDELSRRGDLDGAGGMEYIAALIDVVPTAANVDFHAKIVRDKARWRDLAAIVEHIKTETNVDGIHALIARAQAAANELAPAGAVDHHLTTDLEWLGEPTPPALIEGLMPAAGHTLIFGPPGSLKTFVAMAIAGAVATGTDVLGRRVLSPGPVVFVVGEGHSLFPCRLAALREHLKIAPGEASGVLYFREQFSLLSDLDVTRLLERSQQQLGGLKPRLFVIDPLASLMSPGDENSTPDMNLVTKSLNRIRAATGAATLIIHHTGWNFERERGSIVLRASCDAVYSLKREDDAGVLECVKMRDGAPPPPHRLRLAPVRDSGVVMLATAPAATDMGGISKSERIALEALAAIAIDDQGATSSAWLQTAQEGKSQIGRGTYFRARKRLVDLKLVHWDRKAKRYSLTGAGISRAVPSPN